jgi:integrase
LEAFYCKSGRNGRSTVKVENDEGRLRLRFTYAGKRHALALGLPDSNVNRVFAQQWASQIELEIVSGNFNPTLKKSKPQRASAQQHTQATAAGMFEKFTQEQAKDKGVAYGEPLPLQHHPEAFRKVLSR